MATVSGSIGAATVVPPSLSVPLAGGLVIITASKAFGGESAGSLNAKSFAENVYAAFSLVLTVLSALSGGSFTGVTLIVSVLEKKLRSKPLLAVPPSSCTLKVKLAYVAPLP